MRTDPQHCKFVSHLLFRHTHNTHFIYIKNNILCVVCVVLIATGHQLSIGLWNELHQKLTDRRVTDPDYPTGNVLGVYTNNQNLYNLYIYIHYMYYVPIYDNDHGATESTVICNIFVDAFRKSFKMHTRIFRGIFSHNPLAVNGLCIALL